MKLTIQKRNALFFCFSNIYQFVVIIFLFSGNLWATYSGNIRVEISNVDTTKPGKIQVSLFNKAEGFPTNEKALRISKIQPSPNVVINFENIPFGDYAIVIIHDENENGKMDMKWLPYPHPGEGYAISNNATSRIGPPKFDPAKFALTTSILTIRLALTY